MGVRFLPFRKAKGGVQFAGYDGADDGGGGGSYVLPVATPATLGGVKVGDGLTISNDGVLSLYPNAHFINYESDVTTTLSGYFDVDDNFTDDGVRLIPVYVQGYVTTQNPNDLTIKYYIPIACCCDSSRLSLLMLANNENKLRVLYTSIGGSYTIIHYNISVLAVKESEVES